MKYIILLSLFISCGSSSGGNDTNNSNTVPRTQRDSVLSNHSNIVLSCDVKDDKLFVFLIDSKEGFYTLYESNGIDTYTVQEGDIDLSTYVLFDDTEGKLTFDMRDAYTDSEGTTHRLTISQSSENSFTVFDEMYDVRGVLNLEHKAMMINCDFNL